MKNNNNLETKLMLNEFNLLRKKETKNILRFTDSLVMLFSNNFVGINRLRGMALSILDLAPPLKKRFVKKMSYGK
jgi:2-octaprenyl-6-methoxyphenol hydroxylase